MCIRDSWPEPCVVEVTRHRVHRLVQVAVDVKHLPHEWKEEEEEKKKDDVSVMRV